ncbi:MAG: FHA domain-containing protein [Gemmataceae bacterium]|jgi:predicted component of type VI protein secretion system|nr:FHA domain-containing protein [Gemmataceae bacterium]MBJ7432310.1 FHA domain-containing protein [Gemmataceae bacterium]MBJ7497799.1 FHA domain-containing protein [Gemmataceae bacterium]
MKISLVVLTAGKMMGKEIPITAAEFRIGKDPSCQLKPATGVSDKHCAFLVKQGKLFLVDLGSAEGTFVNDNKISAEVELKPKDKVKVGPLLFEVKIEAPAAKPAVAVPAAKPAVVAPAAKPEEKVEPKKSSGDGEDDLDDLLFDDDDKAPAGAKPSWKDAAPEAGAEKDAGGSGATSEGGAKPEEKPKPTANTSDAAAALFAKFRLKK